jgi:hypothetical protein
MFSRSNRIIQVVSSILIFSVGTLFASGPQLNNNLPAQAGVLQTSSPVSINGNQAEDGIVILSGSRIQTLNKGASVQIPQVGLIQLDSGTNATLDFTKQNVTLNLTTGNAKLIVKDGINGKIVTNTGKTVKTTTALSKISSDSSAQDDDDDDDDNNLAWYLLPAIIAAVVIVFVVTSDDDDSSPVRR